MEELLNGVRTRLEQVRQQLSCDFSAVARLDRGENRIRWECVSGNISTRLFQMSKKPGSGISGHVVRYGRPIVLDASTPNLEQERNKYPIMLAERLNSIIAVPLHRNEQIEGALIAGNREKRRFTPKDLSLAESMARTLFE